MGEDASHVISVRSLGAYLWLRCDLALAHRTQNIDGRSLQLKRLSIDHTIPIHMFLLFGIVILTAIFLAVIN